jgi:hypothetical protein
MGGGTGRAEDRDPRPVDPFRVTTAHSSPALAGLGGVAPAEVAFQHGHPATLGAGSNAAVDTIESIRPRGSDAAPGARSDPVRSPSTTYEPFEPPTPATAALPTADGRNGDDRVRRAAVRQARRL